MVEKYRIKKIAELVAGKQRLLDVGWADVPNVYLTNLEVVGLDLAKRELPKNYSSCYVGDVMRLPKPFDPESFDAIIAGEILEHLENPLEFLRGCFKTLIPGSIFVLSTPNPNSLIERLLTVNLSRRYFYDLEHICLYPQRWLIRMMEKVGFNDVKLYSGGFPAPIFGTIPFPRIWCHQTIAVGKKL